MKEKFHAGCPDVLTLGIVALDAVYLADSWSIFPAVTFKEKSA
jgi:hypothetical protein